MGMMTISSIPDEVHNALKARAKRHRRSIEAEVRAILEEVTRPQTRLKMGDTLAAMSHSIGLTNEDFEIFEQARSRASAEPMRFE